MRRALIPGTLGVLLLGLGVLLGSVAGWYLGILGGLLVIHGLLRLAGRSEDGMRGGSRWDQDVPMDAGKLPSVGSVDAGGSSSA